jgi:crossover junction endodeoxyribonuclease RuvC
MRALGVDPGSLITGYGVVESDSSRLILVAQGRVTLKRSDPFSIRLKQIYDALSSVIFYHQPQEAAVESLFFAKNVDSALKLGQARGAAMLSAANAGLEIFEYAPREVKKNVCGYGGADKRQVQHMVRTLLSYRGDLEENISDALAIAICHLTTSRSPLCTSSRSL